MRPSNANSPRGAPACIAPLWDGSSSSALKATGSRLARFVLFAQSEPIPSERGCDRYISKSATDEVSVESSHEVALIYAAYPLPTPPAHFSNLPFAPHSCKTALQAVLLS